MLKTLRVSLALIFILYTSYQIRNAAPLAQAQTMSNDNYIIKMQGFNAISGVTSGKDYELRSTVGDLSPIVGEGVNFKVKTGFENLASNLPFSILKSIYCSICTNLSSCMFTGLTRITLVKGSRGSEIVFSILASTYG